LDLPVEGGLVMLARRLSGPALTATLVTTLVVPFAQTTPASAAGCTSLHSGSRGACVTTLQKRLVALRYDLGAPDGTFGPQTYHAVMAFQKVNGLSRTGAVNATTWYRLFHSPVVPRLRYIRSGNGLEVNLTRQVLLRASSGVLIRIYDVSTGRPSLPTPVSGSRPFTIWRRALWGSTGYNDREHYVQYFYRGTLLAMHAYNYVPPFPTSHGCVRLYPPSAARLWSATYAGERVFTYR
jgi:hypothetical protein